MKNLIILAAAFCTAFASCQGTKSPKSFTTADSVAYAYGVWVGSSIRQGDSTMNSTIFAAAFREVFAGKAVMTAEEANQFLGEWFNVRKPALDLAEGTAWLEKVKAENPNIQTTASGLMYEIINAGDANIKATSAADQVVAKYRGTFKDGTEFDRHDSIPFPLNGVIQGWTEGLQLIGKGGEIVLWVPSELGYGITGRGQVPPNTALKFEVTLLDVIPAEPVVTE
jgi:FKBP-type peptidyl-prolyl cis-trans isomerase